MWRFQLSPKCWRNVRFEQYEAAWSDGLELMVFDEKGCYPEVEEYECGVV